MIVRSILKISALLPAFLLATPAQAQIQRSMTNTGFEANDPGGPGAATFQIFNNGAVPGWDSTSGFIEEWDTNFQGVPAFEGVVFAELNANAPGALFQNICVMNGEVLRWRFAHRARSGGLATQTVRFEIADNAGTVLQSLQTSATASTTSWTVRSNTAGVTYTGASGIQRVQFITPDAGSFGNFLDDITVGFNPYVELSPAATNAREGNISPTLPSLRVTGSFTSSVNVTINITGGTATLGTDYTTPSGTNTFTVTIPAGNYQSAAIPLGVVITQDNIVDAGETIQFAIGANPSSYSITSTTTCGGTPNATSVHTILDDQIVANDNNITNINGYAGANAVLNAFTNDVLEGQPVTAANVTATVLSPATPINGGQIPVLNTATGAVNVPAGTRAGTYVIRYQICQTLDPTNCAAANITVTVAPSADLVMTKTNTFGINGNVDQANDTVLFGSTTTYSLIVTNNGPESVTGAIVTDIVGSRLNCAASNPVTITGSGIPAGSYTISNLTGSGIALGLLANGQSTRLSYNCQVN